MGKYKERRKYYAVAGPTGGLKLELPSTMIEDRETPDCIGVTFNGGNVERARGVRAFGGTDIVPLVGIVLHVSLVNSHLIIHTTTNVYDYDSTTETFTDITDAGGPYTGDHDNPYDSTYFSLSYIYIFTNGVDRPRKWDFITPDVELLGGTANYLCKAVEYFGGRFCMYNMTETGTAAIQRCRWSVVNDPEDFVGAGSGYVDLVDALAPGDEIVRALRLGDYVVIYGKESIAVQTYLGQVTNPFAFLQRVSDVGLAAPRALIQIGKNRHMFLGKDDVYTYEDGEGVKGIAEAVKDDLFGRLTASAITRSFMLYLPERQLVRLYVPTSGDIIPNQYYEYHLVDDVWSRSDSDSSGGGVWDGETNPTWDDLPGTWDELAGTWEDLGSQRLVRVAVLGDEDGLVNLEDIFTYYGTCYWDSKDFAYGNYIRDFTNWISLSFEARGGEINVYYSTDLGVTYTLIDTETLGALWGLHRIDLNVNSGVIRFRFEPVSANDGFRMRWFEVGFIPATDRSGKAES